MAIDVTRRRFVGGSAAVAGGLTLGGPMSALAQRSGQGSRARAVGYGPLQPTPEQDSGEIWLDLPRGFKYRIISRQGETMDDGNPTPGIFDGMAAYPAKGGNTILIRNHENRSRDGEIAVDVPPSKRYDPDLNVRGGNTKLVVNRQREVTEQFAVLGGTHTNCAGGFAPWRSWITCEEIFNYGSVENNVTPGTGVPHGFAFEVDADADGPVDPVPITAAGRFAREAVAWLDGVLYQTEDRGDAAFYRFLPRRRPDEVGDLAAGGGVLEALVVRGRPNFDANTANPGESYPVEWVTIQEPNPPERHRPRAGSVQRRCDLRPHGGDLVRRTQLVLRLHDRRRGAARSALAVHAQGPQRRHAEADLRVDEHRRSRGAGQPGGGAAHGRRLPA